MPSTRASASTTTATACVWERYDGTDWRVQARTLSEVNIVGATQTLSSVGKDGVDPDVAVDYPGDAVAVWRNGSDQRIQARTRDVRHFARATSIRAAGRKQQRVVGATTDTASGPAHGMQQ